MGDRTEILVSLAGPLLGLCLVAAAVAAWFEHPESSFEGFALMALAALVGRS